MKFPEAYAKMCERRARLQVRLSQFGQLFHQGIYSQNIILTRKECEDELKEITRRIKEKEKSPWLH